MFRRAFWFATGAATGIWATTKVQRTLRGLSPDSLAARASGRAVAAGARLRDLAVDVRTGMAQRESELNEALGITDTTTTTTTTTPPGITTGRTGKEDH
jgi:hypothetical protein